MAKKAVVDSRLTGEFTPKELTKADKVLKRITGVDDSKGKMANLPLVSSLYDDTDEMQAAIELLATGHNLKAQIDRLTKGTDEEPGLDGIREQVIAMAVGRDVPGYRWGDIAVSVSTSTSSRLDKNLLAQLMIDEGIDPEVVGRLFKEATKESDPFYVCKFVSV